MRVLFIFFTLSDTDEGRTVYSCYNVRDKRKEVGVFFLDVAEQYEMHPLMDKKYIYGHVQPCTRNKILSF